MTAASESFVSCPTHGWLNVGRHEWRQPANLLSAARLMLDSMWEDRSRDGQFIKTRDMCRFCPTVGRNATGRVKILITRTASKTCMGVFAVSWWGLCAVTAFFSVCLWSILLARSTSARADMFTMLRHLVIYLRCSNLWSQVTTRHRNRNWT